MSYFGRRAPKLVWHPVDAVLIQMAYAGTKVISRNRETGTITSITDERISPEQDCIESHKEWISLMDGDQLQLYERRVTIWGVSCDTHGAGLCDHTLEGAKAAQSYPTNFCEACINLWEEGIVLTAAQATSPRVESMIREARKLAGKNYPLLRKAGVTRVRRSLKAQGVLK